MSNSKSPGVSGDFVLKAVIIYNDLGFVAKANARLQRIGSQPNVDACWTVQHVPTDALNDADAVENILLETMDAQLIVISARQASAIPSRLGEWLERWAALRQIQDAALAVIADGVDANFVKSANAKLARLTQTHGLNLIIDEDPVAVKGEKLVWRYSDEPELPAPPGQPRIIYSAACESFRGYGINE